MADQNPEATSSVFISYSRKDKEFVKKLNDGLDASGVSAWVDWEGIPLSADWMAEITRAIEGADAFLFVISPDSLASKVCADELELGLQANKKLIPILYRQPSKNAAMHEKLAATNWVYLREQDDFSSTLAKLLEAINTDLDWVRQHTRLYQRSVEWNNKNKNASFLLQGADLSDAERWLAEGASKADREVHALQIEYIHASRKMATRRQRNLLIGVSFAFVLSIVLTVFALLSRSEAVTQRQIANANAETAVSNEHARATQQYIAQENEALALKNENIAKSQSSAAQAKIYQSQAGELNVSTLLAIDSWQRLPTFESQDILRYNISLMPIPVLQVKQNGEITSINRSPDGTKFVTTSLDSTACVWDIETPWNHFCFQHDSDVVEGLFTPDGASLVTGSLDGVVQIWNLADQSLKARAELGSPILDMDISPDGKILAVGRDDDTVSILDLETGREIYTLRQTGSVYVVKFSPRGSWLAIGTSTGTVLLWKTYTDLNISGPQHTGEVYAITFSPDGKWLVSVGSDSKARVASVSLPGQFYAVAQGDWIEDVAFSPDSSWFVTVGDDNKIKVWDTTTGNELLSMSQDHFVQKVRVSPNGHWIATTGKDGTIRVWDSATGGQVLRIPLGSRGTALLFTDDGNSLIAGDAEGNIGIWDISLLQIRANYILFPEYTRRAVFSPSGEWLAVNTDDKKIWLLTDQQMFDAHLGTSGVPLFAAKNLTYNMAVSPDGRWLATVEQAGNRALLYNFETKKTINLDHQANVYAVAFSPDSLQVATADALGVIAIWNPDSGERIFEFDTGTAVYSVSFSKTGTLLAAGLNDKIEVYNLLQRSLVSSLVQLGDVKTVTFSDDGNWLASGGTEASVNLWAVQDDAVSESAIVLQHSSEILSIDFSPNGTRLAVGSLNGFAYIWDVATADEIARFAHTNGVTGISFSPDGKLLVTVSRKVVQIWDLSKLVPITTENLIGTACSRLTENFSEAQWQLFFYEEPYSATCENLPVGGE